MISQLLTLDWGILMLRLTLLSLPPRFEHLAGPLHHRLLGSPTIGNFRYLGIRSGDRLPFYNVVMGS